MIKKGSLILFFLLTFLNSKASDFWACKSIDSLSSNDSIMFDSIYNCVANYAGRNLDSAFLINRKLIKKVNKLDNIEFKITASIKMSELSLLIGNIDSTRYFLNKSDSLLTLNPIIENQLSTFYIYGWMFADIGKTDSAQYYYHKAMKIADSIKNYRNMVAMRSNLALILVDAGKKENALKFARDAVDIAKNTDLLSKHSYWSSLYNLASIYQKTDKIDSAVLFYEELLYEYENINYTSGLAGVENNLGHAYLSENDTLKAINSFKKALAYDKEVGTKNYIIIDYINLSDCYKKFKNYDLAIEYLKRADSLAVEGCYLSRQKQVKLELSDIYELKHDYEQAYKALKQSVILADSINYVEIKKKVEEVEAKYQAEKKEQENIMLQQAREKDARFIHFQRKINWLLVGFSVLVLVLLVYNILNVHKISKLNDSLEKSNKKLHLANITKDKFFSIIAHDLRGPIGSINNLLKYGVTDKVLKDPTESARYFGVISKEMKATYGLLENLLTWSRSQFGQIKINSVKLDVRIIVADVLKSLENIADKKMIELVNNIPHNFILTCDLEMLRFIFRNLISNSIKFTNRGGEVSVNTRFAEGKTIIDVVDNGVGMSSENIENLFNIEDAKSSKGTDNEKGTGLGLMLCYEFAVKNGIDIKVYSEEGKGSVFSLVFPDKP